MEDTSERVRTVLVGIASVALIAVALLWTFWGTAEMYHEGWFGSWTNRLPYLAPIAITVVPALLCFRHPTVGGLLLLGVGILALGMFDNQFVALMAIAVMAAGAVFVWDGVSRRRRDRGATEAAAAASAASSVATEGPWWRRNLRATALIGLTTVLFVAVSAFNLPVVLSRIDDGNRSSRLIVGNGSSLVWAPEGPGWNWRQEWGGYPSWQSLALYGVPPVGTGDKEGFGKLSPDRAAVVYASASEMADTNLCRYLSDDGLSLLSEPQDFWRMPTVGELVSALGRHGANAGCEWAGELRRSVVCDVRPDKESPLWAADLPPIYYWAADELDERLAYYVAFNGSVNATLKTGGNPRHSHRCVRDP